MVFDLICNEYLWNSLSTVASMKYSNYDTDFNLLISTEMCVRPPNKNIAYCEFFFKKMNSKRFAFLLVGGMVHLQWGMQGEGGGEKKEEAEEER